MKYYSGDVVKIGDQVRAWENCLGVVVCSMDTDEYSAAYPKVHWSYLRVGVMIETESADLVYYPTSDEDLELIERVAPEMEQRAQRGQRNKFEQA